MADLGNKVLANIFGKLPGGFNSAFGLDEPLTDLEPLDDGGEIVYSKSKPGYIARLSDSVRNFGRKISDGIAYHTAFYN